MGCGNRLVLASNPHSSFGFRQTGSGLHCERHCAVVCERLCAVCDCGKALCVIVKKESVSGFALCVIEKKESVSGQALFVIEKKESVSGFKRVCD